MTKKRNSMLTFALEESAETPNNENAEMRKSNNVKTQDGITRKNRGYQLDIELIQWYKIHAAQTNRKIYEVMEEALREYKEKQG